MPFSVITLAAAGADTGPFDLYSDDDSYAVAFETGVSKSSLLAGYYTFVPVGATVVRVKSASELCTNYVDMEITTTTTTTTTTTVPPTTTTTTTQQPSLYRYSSASSEDACTTGLEMDNVVLTDPPFCSATAIQCDEFVLEIAGLPVYIRTGNSYRTATINDPNTSGIATFDAGTCIVCTTTTSTSSTTTTTTTAAPVVRTVTNLSYGASDILGEIYIDASVILSGNVSTDTIVEVVVSAGVYGNISVYVTILNGNSSGSGSTSVGMGSLPSVSAGCIAASDNIYVTFTGFGC